MDALTAIRSFGIPSFSPAKRVRIFNKRWYLLEMQNVETDPRCDYMGLAEGTYVLLLPGSKAREQRDCKLNHCNAIVEWKGQVWTVSEQPYACGQWQTSWYADEKEARQEVEKFHQKRFDWLRKVEKSREDATMKGRLTTVQECDRVIKKHKDNPWPATIMQVR